MAILKRGPASSSALALDDSDAVVSKHLSPQLPLDLTLERGSTFSNFIAGSNGAAVAALRSAAESAAAQWPLLTGGHGYGKTHLLHAVCHAAADHGRRAMLLPAGQLLQFGPALLGQIEQVDVLAIDDVDQLIGNASWDQALFHLFNQLRQRSATLVLTSRTEPAALQPVLADLKSRISWGLIFTLQGLSEAARVELLKRRALNMGIELDPSVVSYLMRRAPRDVASLLALLARIEHISLVEKRRITVPFLREQFPELRASK